MDPLHRLQYLVFILYQCVRPNSAGNIKSGEEHLPKQTTLIPVGEYPSSLKVALISTLYINILSRHELPASFRFKPQAFNISVPVSLNLQQDVCAQGHGQMWLGRRLRWCLASRATKQWAAANCRNLSQSLFWRICRSTRSPFRRYWRTCIVTGYTNQLHFK